MSFILLSIFTVAQILAACTARSSSIEIKFVKNLVALEDWKEVVIVHCSENADAEIFIRWRKVLPALLYMRVFQGHSDPVSALSTRVVNSGLHVLILSSCSPGCNFVIKAAANGYFNKYFFWWILSSPKFRAGSQQGNYELAHPSIADLHLPADSYVNLVSLFDTARKGQNTQCAEVCEVFRMHRDMPIVWRKIETWCETHRVLSFPDRQKSKNKFPVLKEKIQARSVQMKGIPLRVGVLMGKEDYAYDCKVQLDADGKARLDEGYSAQIFKILRDLLQFRDEYVFSKTWGSLHNSSWSGLIGLLTTEKADIILCHPTITPERRDVVEFLHPTFESTRVLVYHATRLPLTQDVFVLTFSSSLWLCFFVAMLLLILSLSYSTRTYSKMNEGQLAWSWVEVSLWAISVTCQQGTSKEPLGPSCCIVFIVGYISSYLIFTAFAAGVTSLLAVEGQDVNLQLRNVAEMNLNLAFYLDGRTEITIKEATIDNPFLSSYISKEISVKDNRIYSMNELIGKLKDNNRVSLGSYHPVQQFMLKHLANKEACQLTVTPIPNTRNLKAFAVPKNSAYKEVLNYWLLRIHEGGLLRAASQRSMLRKSDCESGPGYSSAGIGHVMSAIMIFTTGVCASIVLLFMELAWGWHKKRQLRQNKQKAGQLNYHKNIREVARLSKKKTTNW